MPLMDYSKSLTFCDTAEAVSVVLQHALVQLRDHAKFQDEQDSAVVRAAEVLSSVLEDAQAEVEQLIGRMAME